MLCPRKPHRVHIGSQQLEEYPRDLYFGDCDKEKCEWWCQKAVEVKTGVVDNGVEEKTTELITGCAVKIAAMRMMYD